MEVSSPPDLVGASQTKGEVESSDTAVSITTEQAIPLGYLRRTPTWDYSNCLPTSRHLTAW